MRSSGARADAGGYDARRHSTIARAGARTNACTVGVSRAGTKRRQNQRTTIGKFPRSDPRSLFEDCLYRTSCSKIEREVRRTRKHQHVTHANRKLASNRVRDDAWPLHLHLACGQVHVVEHACVSTYTHYPWSPQTRNDDTLMIPLMTMIKCHLVSAHHHVAFKTIDCGAADARAVRALVRAGPTIVRTAARSIARSATRIPSLTLVPQHIINNTI